MKRWFLVGFLLLLLTGKWAPGLAQTEKRGGAMNFQLTIIVDNTVLKKNLQKDWGFSCLVEWRGARVLFDTGSRPEIFAHNFQALGLDARSIHTVFLSHEHADHIGGLPGFLKMNPHVTVWVPASFPQSFDKEVRAFGSKVRRISNATEILPGFYSTGELGTAIAEQSLIVDTPRGLIVVTGCSHPGIVHILETAKAQFHKNILFVVGGFHLNWTDDATIRQIVKQFLSLGVQEVAPAHCTGPLASEIFHKVYEDNFMTAGSGLHLEWNLEGK